MNRDRLEERILHLPSGQNTCVRAAGDSRALLQSHPDFAGPFTASATTPKMRDIAADPRVSIGDFAPLVGQVSAAARFPWTAFIRPRIPLPSRHLATV